MSRHRGLGRIVGEALDEYGDDDDSAYYDDDPHPSSSASSEYIYNRNRTDHSRSVASFVTPNAKPARTPHRPLKATPSASITSASPLPPPHPTRPPAPAPVAAGFSAGDYADDDFIPTDDSVPHPSHANEYYGDEGEEEEEEWWEEEEEGEVDQSAYADDYAAPVPSKPAKKTTPAKPPTPSSAAASKLRAPTPTSGKAPAPSHVTPTRSPSPFSSTLPPLTPTFPPPKVQRSAAEEADTAAAVEALRLEKLRLTSSPSLTRGISQDPPTLARSFSPSPSTPTSATAAPLILRSSSSAEQLSSFATHKRNASRLALIEAEEKREGNKPRINLVVIGHVDAGKSTLMGHLLYLLGRVSQRVMHRYEKESREAGKASFHFAWVLDQQEEERVRGITVDVAVNHFDTASKRVTLLDAPGHRDFIPNMISGAAQADAAVLVVPAVQGEFEAGFVEEGQIREHAILARSLGVAQLIVAVNKCDVVEWREERYRQILALLLPFLKQTGFRERDVQCVPVSGLTGENLLTRKEAKLAWYTGPTLLELIDQLALPKRSADKPFRCCVSEVFKSQTLGVTVAGRIDSGAVMKGDSVLILPQGEVGLVRGVEMNGEIIPVGRVGDNVDVGLRDLTDPSLLIPGSWLCDPAYPIPLTSHFKAQILTTALSTPLLQGATCVLHTQSASEEVVLTRLIAVLDKATNAVIKARPRVLSRGQSAEVEVSCKRLVPLELYREYRELGRFSLRRGVETVAVGIVTELYDTDKDRARKGSA